MSLSTEQQQQLHALRQWATKRGRDNRPGPGPQRSVEDVIAQAQASALSETHARLPQDDNSQ